MKKYIVIVSVILVVVILSSCGIKDSDITEKATNSNEISELTTAYNDIKDETTTTDDETTATDGETTALLPVVEPVYINAIDLGLTPIVIRNEKTDLPSASLTASDGNIELLAKSSGTADVTVMNEYSEAAIINVIVDEKLKIHLTIKPFVKPEHSVIVSDFGAKGDGITNNTTYIQNAIDSLPNGGTVYIPAGVYKTNCLSLREGIQLRLAGCLPATIGMILQLRIIQQW